jgi:hypothetical protein
MKSSKKIAFLHGLESVQPSEKSIWLDSAFDDPYCPGMDYKDPTLFERVLKEIQERKIEVIIGSSMGGYFAYHISTITGIPTVLFNPAMASRSFEPLVQSGNELSNHEIIYGLFDDVISANKTRQWFEEHGLGAFHFHQEFMGHRTPMNIFTKYVSEFTDF